MFGFCLVWIPTFLVSHAAFWISLRMWWWLVRRVSSSCWQCHTSAQDHILGTWGTSPSGTRHCMCHILGRAVNKSSTQKHRAELEEAISPGRLPLGSQSSDDLVIEMAKVLTTSPGWSSHPCMELCVCHHTSRKTMLDVSSEFPVAGDIRSFLRMFFGQEANFCGMARVVVIIMMMIASFLGNI